MYRGPRLPGGGLAANRSAAGGKKPDLWATSFAERESPSRIGVVRPAPDTVTSLTPLAGSVGIRTRAWQPRVSEASSRFLPFSVLLHRSAGFGSWNPATLSGVL